MRNTMSPDKTPREPSALDLHLIIRDAETIRELTRYADAYGCWESLREINESSSRAWVQIGLVAGNAGRQGARQFYPTRGRSVLHAEDPGGSF